MTPGTARTAPIPSRATRATTRSPAAPATTPSTAGPAPPPRKRARPSRPCPSAAARWGEPAHDGTEPPVPPPGGGDGHGRPDGLAGVRRVLPGLRVVPAAEPPGRLHPPVGHGLGGLPPAGGGGAVRRGPRPDGPGRVRGAPALDGPRRAGRGRDRRA